MRTGLMLMGSQRCGSSFEMKMQVSAMKFVFLVFRNAGKSKGNVFFNRDGVVCFFKTARMGRYG